MCRGGSDEKCGIAATENGYLAEKFPDFSGLARGANTLQIKVRIIPQEAS
jgi:hypothetical protein